MKSQKISIILLITFLGQPVFAQSAFTRPADAIKYRQGLFEVMSLHSQRIGSMVKNERAFDKTIAENDATIIALMANQIEAAFPAGSENPPSKSRPEVWEDAPQFKKKLEELKISSQKLAAAAKAGDANILRAAFSATAQSCKSCHESFRNR